MFVYKKSDRPFLKCSSEIFDLMSCTLPPNWIPFAVFCPLIYYKMLNMCAENTKTIRCKSVVLLPILHLYELRKGSKGVGNEQYVLASAMSNELRTKRASINNVAFLGDFYTRRFFCVFKLMSFFVPTSTGFISRVATKPRM